MARAGSVVIVTLGFGITDRSPRSDDERAHAIAKSIRCPTCRGPSVADSEAPIAAFLRREITRRINEGDSDTEIRAALVERYG